MTMDDRHDIRPRAVDFPMDEALQVGPLSRFGQRLPIVPVADDVVPRDQPRCPIARQQKDLRVTIVPHTDMAKAIHDPLVVQNTIRLHELVDEVGVGLFTLHSHLSPPLFVLSVRTVR